MFFEGGGIKIPIFDFDPPKKSEKLKNWKMCAKTTSFIQNWSHQKILRNEGGDRFWKKNISKKKFSEFWGFPQNEEKVENVDF